MADRDPAPDPVREQALRLLRQGQFTMAESLIRRGDASLQELVENLRIYQVELEAQAAELRESQTRLQMSAARFESLFQSLPVPALVVDDMGLVHAANRACEKAFGIGRVRAGFAALLRWLPQPEDRTRLRLALDGASDGRITQLLGVELAHDAGIAVCDLSVERLPPMGGAGSVVVTLVDQTERLDAHRRLQTLHDELLRQQGENLKLAAVARLTGQVVIVTDPQHRITWVNDTFTRVTGWAIDEVRGRIPEELLHGPDTDRQVAQAMSDRLRLGQSVEGLEIQHVARDGRPYWVQVEVQPVRDQRGVLVQYVSVLTDVTERRRSDEALRRSEAQQRAIFDAEPHALLLMRRDSTILMHNAAAAGLFGLEAAGDGGLLSDRLPAEHRAAFEVLLAGVQRGETQSLRLTCKGPSGDPVPVDLRCMPLMKAASVDAVLAVGRDVSEELAAQALRVQHSSAEAASRAKTDFIARMSHELRTPLNAMLGFAQLLEAELGRAPLERQREQLTHMLGAGWHLLAMINDLLDLSRIEADRISVECRPAPLLPIVEEAVAMVQPMAVRQQVSLLVPQGADRTQRALVDPTRLAQVLSNLLSNAVKYNHPQGWVRVRLGGAEATSWIEVADSGQGLNEEQRAHLFEPFNRLGAERSNIEGTGIGLVIARRLVELMGGRIELVSGDGPGTAFRVHVRTAPDSAKAPEAEADRASQATLPSPATRPRRLLYVEDDPVNALLVQAMLAQRGGWNVTVAVTGTEGLRLARELQPDVLLLDMQLPDMTGLQLRDHLLADPMTADLPCLMLTADATEATQRRALELGVLGVQHKPVRVAELLASLDSVHPSTGRH